MRKLEDAYNIYVNSEKKDKTFVLSVLFHERINTIIIYLMNALYCFKNYNLYILISCNESMYYFLNKTNLPDNIIIVNHRDDKIPIWGNVNLFDQHVLNYLYLKNNNIKYDYFWFSASNDIFIKQIDDKLEEKIIKKPENYICEMTKEKVAEFYDDFLKNSTWSWYVRMIQDTHTINTFIQNNILVKCNEFEGLVLPFDLMTELFEFYLTNLYEKNTSKTHIIEEFYIPSYLLSKYNMDYDTFTVREQWCKYNDLKGIHGIELLKNVISKYDKLYCIKAIDREPNNVIREYALNMFSD